MRFAWLVTVSILGVGCGSDLSREQACTVLATARCGQLETCCPAELTRRWPDASTCESREKLACMDARAAPRTAATPTSDKACADALTAETCDAFLTTAAPPDGCLPQHGPLGSGAACAFSAECATGFCSVADDALCATCAEVPAAGASCATSGCGPTMTCVKTTMTCQVPGTANSACSKDMPLSLIHI